MLQQNPIAKQVASFWKLLDNIRPYLISCDTLRREIEKLIEQGSLSVEPYFLDMNLHLDYYLLEKSWHELSTSVQETSQKEQSLFTVIYAILRWTNSCGARQRD